MNKVLDFIGEYYPLIAFAATAIFIIGVQIYYGVRVVKGVRNGIKYKRDIAENIFKFILIAFLEFFVVYFFLKAEFCCAV